MSRRMPHFNRETLTTELPKTGIQYVWEKDMGGRRGKQPGESPNLGLRNDSFRNYADYMLTPAFQAAAARVLDKANDERVAVMCAERVYFHCHRMLVSDYYVAHGHEVLHIDDEKPARPHKLTTEAMLVEGRLVYPAHPLLEQAEKKR